MTSSEDEIEEEANEDEMLSTEAAEITEAVETTEAEEEPAESALGSAGVGEKGFARHLVFPNDPGFPSPRGYSGQRHLSIINHVVQLLASHDDTLSLNVCLLVCLLGPGITMLASHDAFIESVSYYLSASWGQASRCWHNKIIS